VEGDSSGVWRFLPDACLVLGTALGVANLAAGPQTSGWLRVPALLAALILVAQGLLGIQERGAKKKAAEAEQASRADRVAESDRSNQGRVIPSDEVVIHDSRQSGGRTVAVGQPIQAAALDAPAGAGTPVRENRGPMVLVLVLAVWLGLATLNYSNSPPYLLALSLVASSLLFTSAWNMLQKGAT